MAKTKVVILYGGRSVEHDISILSARNIIQNIDKDQFETFLIAIDRDGKWYTTKSIDEPIATGHPVKLNLDAKRPSFQGENEAISADVVFPVLHGTDGEDGAIQGMLKTVGLPYVGSGVLGSSVAMDKLISKQILESCNLPVARYLSYTDEDKTIDFDFVSKNMGLPFIVKPINLGSSVGVSKVNSSEEFERALADAFRYDHTILIEEFIDGREVECAILGNNNPVVSMAGEIILSDNYEFYSFTAKYEDPDAAAIKIPADMDSSIHQAIQENSLKAYRALKCLDLSRVDLFVTDNGQVYINEVNTIPGFTNISMYPSLMKHEGISYTDLISKLLFMAIERSRQDQTITTNYDSQL